MTRDRYLPSPEICDWLLAQEWSKPATCTVDGPDGKSEIYDCCQATAALGRDECIDLVLPADGIEMLREDQRQRRETPEQRVEKLNKVISGVAAATGKTVTRKLTVADLDELVDKMEGEDERMEAVNSSADPQTALIKRILAEAKQSNLTVNQVAEALHTAAQSLISRACAVTLQDSQP